MTRAVIGLLPAAGRATRSGPIAGSKEIYPIGRQAHVAGSGTRPKAVCEYLLDLMSAAGISRAYVILRSGKWDIPEYLADGSAFGMSIGYLLLGPPYGVPYTLDQATPFLGDNEVALGFPDIVYQSPDAFERMLDYRRVMDADVVLGLFPAARPDKSDLVESDAGGVVHRVVVKQPGCMLPHTWGLAVWRASFTRFLHEFLVGHRTRAARAPELHMGDVVQAAIDARLRILGTVVSDRPFIDIGTPEDLARARALYG